jgi:hypothetical protein
MGVTGTSMGGGGGGGSFGPEPPIHILEYVLTYDGFVGLIELGLEDLQDTVLSSLEPHLSISIFEAWGTQWVEFFEGFEEFWG